MDEDLERLAREAAIDPSDETAARRYDAALARAGREDELARRFRFKFECPKQWAELTAVRGAGEKHCEECRRSVFAVGDVAQFREHVSKGDCVAVPSSLLASAFAELPKDRRLHSAEQPASPCVVPGGTLPAEIPEDVRRLVSREIAESFGAAPIGVKDGKVVVATARATERQLRGMRRFFGRREIETVLVSQAELTALFEAMPLAPRMLLGKVAPPREG